LITRHVDKFREVSVNGDGLCRSLDTILSTLMQATAKRHGKGSSKLTSISLASEEVPVVASVAAVVVRKERRTRPKERRKKS
jgi:hypothetical protein